MRPLAAFLGSFSTATFATATARSKATVVSKKGNGREMSEERTNRSFDIGYFARAVYRKVFAYFERFN